MDVIIKDEFTFYGEHKGAIIEIDQEDDGLFYIQVRSHNGAYLYDGWAPEEVSTIDAAVQEAIKGAQL